MSNVYVQRDAGQDITGVFANKQPGYAEELLADDHQDVVKFQTPPVVKPETDYDAKLIAAISKATTIAGLKAALIGSGDGAKARIGGKRSL